MATTTTKVYEKQEDGTVILKEVIEVDAPTTEDIIKDKEQKMLELYEEIKRLKGE
jgi:hypothetical protein